MKYVENGITYYTTPEYDYNGMILTLVITVLTGLTLMSLSMVVTLG